MWKTTLGWASGNSLDDIKRKYRQALLRTHPNKGGTAEEVSAVYQAFANAERAFAAKKPAPRRSPPAPAANNGLCMRSTLAKYATRPGPPYPANDVHCHGKNKLGNDGKWYRSVPDKRGIHTWKKSGAQLNRKSPTPPPKRKSPTPPPKRKRSPSVVNLTGNNNIRPRPSAPSPPNRNLNSALNIASWTPMLAQTLNRGGGVPPGRWYVSEKLDGVRALWDGKGALWTRGRNRIDAPAWFVAALPRGLALDGELFAGRGQFRRVNGAWRTARSEAWPDIQFRVFDAPKLGKVFSETYDALKKRLETCPDGTNAARKVCLVRQTPLTASVQNMMKNILKRGGEGVILRKADSRYAGTRSSNMLKVKDIRDAEAIVTGYKQGTGRLEGTMGALECRWAMDNNRRSTFFVGAGFSDAERRAHRTQFPIGSKITVEFMELTAAGKPRHPRFKGLRSNI